MSSIRNKIWSWGYVLDHVPTAAPFVFGKTKCSLERESAYLGVRHSYYMNSMFSRTYLKNHFPHTEEECFDNCIDNRLSDEHFRLMDNVDDIICTLEHDNYLESARQIARLSLKYPKIKGVNIDDFNGEFPSIEKCHDNLTEIRDAMKEINPALKLAIVTYSHSDATKQIEPFTDLVDIVSRWRWVASKDYWDHHKDDIRKVRDIIGPEKKIFQGIYIHDFGSDMKCQYPVPLDTFQKSISTCCEHLYDNTLDGLIIPQSGWFSSYQHFEHISWMKNYLDWFEGTSDLR